MPKFIYTAKSFSGESKGGEMTASDEKSLAQQLRSDGYLVTSVRRIDESEASSSGFSMPSFFHRVSLKDKMLFARNLSVMASSGLSISRSIKNLSNQTKNENFKKILLDINEEIQKGNTLSNSLAKYPDVFSDLFVNMVRVGEAGGSLDEALKIISVQMEKEDELISKVRGAMVYPAVIIVAMIIVGILMLVFVLPKITAVFSDMNVQLPAATRFLIFISDFLRDNPIVFLIVLSLIIFCIKTIVQTKSGKRILSFVAIRLPAIKNIVIKVNCARFARIYSSLLKSGVSVIDSLRIVSETLTNVYYKQAIKKSLDGIQKGIPLSKIILEDEKIFPVLVGQMLEVGEETGKTEEIMLKLAEFYEDEVSQITKNMSSIIEPVLMLLIGGTVGFFAISMLQPMYSILENIK